MSLKTTIRESVIRPLPRKDLGNAPGRIGEHLRRNTSYRQASLVFVTPAEILRQIRMNVLTDNKALLMPSSHLREGFYLLKPFSIPFKELAKAVTPAGLSRFGIKLKAADLRCLRVDFVIAETLAVDRDGYMVGDGNGFLDLTVAILAAYGAMAAQTMIVTVPTESQTLAELHTPDPWDVRAHAILSVEAMTELRNPKDEKYPILWEQLTLDRIKRITPLWQLYRAKEDAKALESAASKS